MQNIYLYVLKLCKDIFFFYDNNFVHFFGILFKEHLMTKRKKNIVAFCSN